MDILFHCKTLRLLVITTLTQRSMCSLQQQLFRLIQLIFTSCHLATLRILLVMPGVNTSTMTVCSSIKQPKIYGRYNTLLRIRIRAINMKLTTMHQLNSIKNNLRNIINISIITINLAELKSMMRRDGVWIVDHTLQQSSSQTSLRIL
jgi:hypothetical protein